MLFEAYTGLVRQFPSGCEGLYGTQFDEPVGLWLAVDASAYPSLLLTSDRFDTRSDIELRFVAVSFSRDCEITTDHGDAEGTFTIIRLEENDPDLVRLFLRLLEEAFCGINAPKDNRAIGERILELANLFRQMQNSTKDIMGLWGELHIISEATSPDFAVRCWCQHQNAKYDFVGDDCALEVKSTLKANREHRFSLEQLRPASDLRVIVASLQLVQTQGGKAVVELVEDILAKIADARLREAFLHLCMTKGGEDIYKSALRYQLLSPSGGMAFFDASDVPVPIVDVDSPISEVRFSVCLDNIRQMQDSEGLAWLAS